MKTSLSLRARLTLVILVPLVLVAALVGAWAYFDAQSNAAERFDRSLLSTALAISRDTAVTGGDALSEETRDLLQDTSGGAVFYHVYAPNGVYVTGYATPPVPPSPVQPGATQTYYDAIYRDEPVRALRFSQSTSIDGLSGLFTFTVWQQTAVRDGFVRSRTGPVFLIIAIMIGALALLVRFGVARGLAPLTDLESAIALRSATDLSPIKRRIPQEVKGIVGRFNNLLGELSRALDTKDAFISDAAHQLRNPIAGVMSLAESVTNAKSLEDAIARSDDLRDAARDVGHLANNLLTLERARAIPAAGQTRSFDPATLIDHVAQSFADTAKSRGVVFNANLSDQPATLKGDPVMFEQAVLNILNNASAHGGDGLTSVSLSARRSGGNYVLEVTDNGIGIDPQDFERALARFSQIGPSAGSGLGLPIAKAVLESFGGTIGLARGETGLTVSMVFPLRS